jgi:hypothetical protein
MGSFESSDRECGDQYARRVAYAQAFLLANGTDVIEHPGGSLYEHLARTANRLRGWNARDDLALAGLCHATYGTGGLDRSLLSHSSRGPLAEIIGHVAEAIVYSYASCDRHRTYRDLAAGRSLLHDRFDGTSRSLDRAEVCDLVELTFANELDVVQHSVELRRRFGSSLATLFASLADYASDGARVAFELELGDLVARPDARE